MGGNVLAEFFKSQEDRKRVQQIEQLRRKGHQFIKVRYVGNIIPALDAEGAVYNLRIHGLRDVEAFEKTDINTGRSDWSSRPGARALTFRQSPTGDVEANIWDDPDGYNRHFLSTHPELEVLDSAVAAQINKLDKSSFKAELSEEEILEREIKAKQDTLDRIRKNKVQEVEPEDTTAEYDEEEEFVDGIPVKAAEEFINSSSRRPRKRGVNGVNESASNVDSSGVSRVATGGVSERDSAAVQSGSSNPERSTARTESII